MLLSKLMAGLRLEKPFREYDDMVGYSYFHYSNSPGCNCGSQIYDLMTNCWADLPHNRPTLSNVWRSVYECIFIFGSNSSYLWISFATYLTLSTMREQKYVIWGELLPRLSQTSLRTKRPTLELDHGPTVLECPFL